MRGMGRASRMPKGVWALLFAALLCVCSAAPVLADPAAPAAEAGAAPLPSPEELTSALIRSEADAKSAQAELEEQWRTPQAERERDHSRSAFADIASGESQSLLLAEFPEQIEELNADPGRSLSNVSIEKPLGTYGALIEQENGEHAIVESSLPVQSEVGEGKKKPIDLSLESKGDAFVPANPPHELELPASADGQIRLEGGVGVSIPSEDAHEAVQLGEMNLFYPETEPSTDTLAAALSSGVELLEQIRSAESPEEFRFELSLPAGAVLRSRSDGGAEVVSSSGDVLKEVPPPTAVDAQGKQVAVTMSVEGDALVVAVPHRSLEVAYPILLDPSVWDAPSFGSGEWGTSSYGGPYDLWNETSALHVASRGWQVYEPYTYGQFVYAAPGSTAFIETAEFSHISFFTNENGTNGCGASEPHGFVGIYNVATNSYTSPGAGEFRSGNSYIGSYTARNGAPNVRIASVGIGNANSQIWIKCNHEMFVGGVTVYESDQDNPTINSVTGVPSGWFDPQKAGSAIIHAADSGFGVHEISIYDGEVTNGDPINGNPGCSGLSGHRCPGEATWTVNPPYAKGERTLKVIAEDPLQHTTTPPWTAKTKVDNFAPDIELSGQFAEATEEEGKEGAENEADENKLSFPVYKMQIKATDGKQDPETERQSGVKNIKIYRDGVQQTVSWGAQSCATYSCGMEETYQLKLLGLTAGEHKLKVVAEDQVGHLYDREIEFEYIPATGIDDEYVMQHFPLPDGEGDETEEENPIRPELAVNVMNGNLVFRQQDVEVTGPGADLEVERVYNSQLPKAQNTEWGAGWTLAQTPELEIEKPQSGPPTDATMVEEDGAVEGSVNLPTNTGEEKFDKEIQAVVTKEANGYEVADESGETGAAVAFNEQGEATELRTPGSAKVEIESEAGALSELAVNDPGTAGGQAEQSAPEPTDPYIFGSTFGGSGSGAGNLSAPSAAATDSEGNVYVADTGHNRIQEFDSKGQFIRQFGATGSGNGQLRSPRGIAISSTDGNLYVADEGNTRVQELTQTGEFVRKWGSAGNGNGQFRELADLAVDPEGHVFTVEAGIGSIFPARVQEFSSEGAFIRTFGSYGTADGRFATPEAIATDSSGNVWVADTGNNRIEEFNSSGEFVRKFGTAGSEAGQLSSPRGLAFDAEGKLWVADSGNDRLERFGPEGAYLATFGAPGNDAGRFSEPRGLAIDGSGNIWVADTGNDRIQESSATETLRTFGGSGSGAGNLSAPSAAATDSEGNVYVADTGHNRIQEFDSKGQFIRQFGATGSGNGQLRSPRGIAISSTDGNLYVADEGNTRVQELTQTGEFVRKWGSAGNGNGQFRELADLAVDPEGHVFTVEAGIGSIFPARVQEFSSEGAFIRTFGSYGTADGRFATPEAIATDSSGNVWVADTGNNRIEEFNSSGEFVRKFGTAGSEAGQLSSPRGLAFDAEGKLWVADSGNDRLERFGPEGAYLATFGAPGNDAGRFSEPRGLAIDGSGNIWVADTGNDRIQESSATETLRTFGGSGSGAGNLSAPSAAATDSEGNVYVADTGHNRIQEFDSKGQFIRQFGATGSGNGQLRSPRGIAISSTDGNLYVADEGNTRVQELTQTGEFVRKWGSAGNGNGQFRELADLAVDPEGHVFTVEAGIGSIFPARVQEFSSEGAFIRTFGSYGTADGRFATPEAIATDSSGNVWVADTGNNRIEEFNSSGEFVRKFGTAGSEAGQLSSPRGLAFDAEGKLWVADSGNDRLERFGPEGAYLATFGAPGNDAGRFSEPRGLAIDGSGNIWVADTGNDRVERWLPVDWNSTYSASVDATGEGEAQLAAPAGVASDAEGNVWIADTGNDRIQEFNEQGESLLQFGATGSENGQFEEPRDIAIDASGNVWVADAGNNRIQEFDSEGEFIRAFGTAGSGSGQFGRLQAVAVDGEGHVWTLEWGTEGAGHPRVQEFSSTGTYMADFGSAGSGPGQLEEPQGLAVDAAGHVWVADTGNKRVEEFGGTGQFLWKFGAPGSEEGQLSAPVDVAVDDGGNIWVVDAANDAFTEFSSEGIFLRRFGSAGSEEGKLAQPRGLALDPSGSIWVADTGNDRASLWMQTSLPAEPPAPEPNPSVEVSTSSGLVSSVEGEAAGTTSYTHSSEKLTAVSGPRGNTAYEYDSAGRLKKVTLPKGTWGEVQYDSVGRVFWVKTSIEGAAATTTYFEYSETPRRTVVTPEKGRATTYDIAPDGSILKWWNSTKAPTIEALEGSLWYQRGEVHPGTISPGDQTLDVLAKSTEGIDSIEIVANGNQIVAEKTCEQDWEVEGLECQQVEEAYVTETENWPPGILQLEVIVTDREGLISTQRFWDNIPYTPPPSPEELRPPTFEETKKFREAFGLDLDIEGNEKAINERIFSLIAAWHAPSTSDGEVARASSERWGVPLRQSDVVEMEYRETYISHDGEVIENWAKQAIPTDYAGYYVDNLRGGIINVGFAHNAQEDLARLKQEVNPMAEAAVRAYVARSNETSAQLDDTFEAVMNAWSSDPTLEENVVYAGINQEANTVEIGSTETGTVEQVLHEILGSEAPIQVTPSPATIDERDGIKGGEHLRTLRLINLNTEESRDCTSGPGAVEWRPPKPNGQQVRADFILTAGHCFSMDQMVEKSVYPRGATNFHWIGKVARTSFREHEHYEEDAEAIRLQDYAPPRYIYRATRQPLAVHEAGYIRPGKTLCFSGITSGQVKCGTAVGVRAISLKQPDNPHHGRELAIQFEKESLEGDSGSPVWDAKTREIVGILGEGEGNQTYAAPLLQPRGFPAYKAPGVLNALNAEGGGDLLLARAP